MKSIGKMRISQIDVPFAAWMEDIPRSATSEEVSKPKPNSTPRGYIFHGLSGLLAFQHASNHASALTDQSF